MNKVVLLTLIGTLAWVTGGCAFLTEFGNKQNRLPENQAQSTPTNTDTTQAQLDAAAEDFADLELESESEPLPEIAGLIPATDPDARARSSVRGRNDPFSTVSLNPRIKIKKEEGKPAQQEPKQQSNPVASRDNYTSSEQSNNNNREDFSAPPSIEPDLARNVIVSGIYRADGRTRIIVKAPDETTSRYVEVGQYVSNGQVLVKKVVRNSPANSTVVLEQSGTEVRKTIGEDVSNNNISALPESPKQDWLKAISLR